MSKHFFVTLLAFVLLAGCTSNGHVQSAAGVLPNQSFGRFQRNDPPPLPSPHLLTSIDTGDVLNITPAQAAPLLSFAHTNGAAGQNDSFMSVGIDTIPYLDINHYIPGDNSGTNSTLSMSDVALTCDGQYVQWVKPDHPTTYLTDPRNPGTLAAWEQWYTNFLAGGGQTWSLYEDTANNPYTFAVPAPPCAADGSGPVTTQEWSAAEEAQEGAMQTFSGKPIIFNGLAPGYHKTMPLANALLDGPAAGGEAEACAPPNTTEWLNQIAIEIHAVQKGKYFVCHGNDSSDGSTPQAIAYRQYQFASMMLDYDLTHTVYESYFGVGASNLRVEPESEVVMESPVKATVNVASDLFKAGGSYARRYKTCYVAGVVVGGCAAVVNPTSAAVPYPFSATPFHHTMLLVGSGIYDGATVSALGPAPSTTVAPYSGEVVFP